MIAGADIKMVDKKGRLPIDICTKRCEKEQSLKDTLGVFERADETKKSCWQKLKEILMIAQPITN